MVIRNGPRTTNPTKKLVVAVFTVLFSTLVNRKRGNSKIGRVVSLMVGKKKDKHRSTIYFSFISVG